MTRTAERVPHVLLRAAIAVLVIVATMTGAVLMHSMIGPNRASIASSTAAMRISSHTEHTAAQASSTMTAVIPGTTVTCAGMCERLCGLMGMACVMVLILFAIAWVRRPSSKMLFLLSHALSVAPAFARTAVPRRTPSLSALSVIRI